MTTVDETEFRRRLEAGDFRSAIKLLESARVAAKRRNAIDELRAIRALVNEAGEKATARGDTTAAERLLYAIDQNIAFALRSTSTPMAAPAEGREESETTSRARRAAQRAGTNEATNSEAGGEDGEQDPGAATTSETMQEQNSEDEDPAASAENGAEATLAVGELTAAKEIGAVGESEHGPDRDQALWAAVAYFVVGLVVVLLIVGGSH